MRTIVISFSCGFCLWVWVWVLFCFFFNTNNIPTIDCFNYFIMKNIRRFGYVGNVRAFGKKTWKTDVCCLRLQCN